MDYKPEYICDLHGHTNMSDGNDTYREFIDIAAEIGMKLVAITDHDVVPKEFIEVDGETLTPVEYAKRKNVGLLLGIEYSCDTDVDDVHIIGFGCDWNHPDFAVEEKNMQISKVEGYRKLTEVLTRNGMDISWEEMLENKGKRRSPEEIQRKHIFEAIAEKGYVPTWQEAKILIRDNPDYNVKRDKIDPLRAIEIIHKSGGIAILAHPHLIDEQTSGTAGNLSRDEYIKRLIDGGLDGIEAAYTYSKTSYKGTMTEKQIEDEIVAKYGKALKIISGGSDYHNDGKKGVGNARMMGEKGVTQEYFTNNKYLSRLLEK